jgi:hypothetical protein
MIQIVMNIVIEMPVFLFLIKYFLFLIKELMPSADPWGERRVMGVIKL